MDNKSECCFFTGHRFISYDEYREISHKLCEEITDLVENYGVRQFFAGGALGFDTLAAATVIKLKEKYDIKLNLILPCKNQTAKWSKSDVTLYNEILSKCDEYHYVSEEYTDDCMLKRNRTMVEKCGYCICYSRKKYGGTAYTLNYAQSRGCRIIFV